MITNLKLMYVHPSKTNPRKRFDENEIAQLADNIKLHGVLQPILVRLFPLGTQARGYESYEIVAGERRYRAAKLAGKEDIPAIVRDLDDVAVLEIQVIENLQRSDLHPLEEAEGYKALILTKQYDVAKIADRMKRPIRYIFDRLKLCELTDDAKALFSDGKLTIGHAVILARLTPAQQKQALDRNHGGIFDHQYGFDPTDVKLNTAKHFQEWVDDHVAFDIKSPDLPELFPQTAAALTEATDEGQKIVAITKDHYLQQEAKGGEKIYFPKSWKAAKKKCDYTVLGVITAGTDRGDSFPVCVSKTRCTTHWATEVKHAQKLAKARASGDTRTIAKAAKKQQRQEQSWEREQRLRKADTERLNKVRPQILEQLVPIVKKMAVKPGNPIWKSADNDLRAPAELRKAYGEIKTADDLMRVHAISQAMPNSWGDRIESAAKNLKPYGIDLAELLEEHAPVEKPKAEKKPAPAKKKPARKKAK